MSISSNIEDEKDDSGIEQDNHWIYIRIAIEDLHLQKVLKFNLDDRIWIAKEKVLQVLFQELNESFNYGLYLPPSNGRAGKFLDESRSLREYPLTGPVCYLEFKYKRRVYKSMNSVSKNINMKINVKKFIDAIRSNQISKVSRYLDKGFDPNIHLSDFETPLSLASIELAEPREMLMTLVNGGAHLDFRTRSGGLTALHYASIHQRKESILTLLELGASANIFDENHLTPLFHLIINTKENDSFGNSSDCCLILLEDHSIVDTRDSSLSTELHHCCRLGLVQHVEHLIFYRADVNAQDQFGNSPLHICARKNQLNCAQILLYRGADRTRVNLLNQTVYDLSLVSSHLEFASIIKNHSNENIHRFEEIPLRNPRRRSIYSNDDQNKSRRRCSSITTTFSSLTHRSQSMPKLNTISTQPISSSSRSSSPKSSSLNSDQGFGGSESNSHLSTGSQKFLTNESFLSQRKRLYVATPGRKCLCIKTYRSNSPGDLSLNKGDIVEILSVADDGFIEGKLNEYQGWFPSHHVQDINIIKNGETKHDDRILISRDALSALMMNNEKTSPRTIVLQRGKKGFGFVLRGSRVAGKLFHPTSSFPALQFLDSIEKGSNADKAGLKQNDYVLEINGVNVISMPHEECVQLIKKSGDTLALKVVTAMTSSTMSQSHYQPHSIPSSHSTQSLPYRRKAPLRPDLEQTFNVFCLSTKSSTRTSPFHSLFDPPEKSSSINKSQSSRFLFDDPDRTLLSECDDQNGINSSEETSSNSNPTKMKPLVPERDSSLYESVSTNQQGISGYQTFRSQVKLHSNSTGRNEMRRNSNSSSNEADEESSLSSLNSNQFICQTFESQQDEQQTNLLYSNSSLTIINTNLSTFKSGTTNGNPSRPSDVKRRSNGRKQPPNIVQMNNSNPSLTTNSSSSSPPVGPSTPPPPPPPPLPLDFNQKKIFLDQPKISDDEKLTRKSSPTDFQNQIEEAKNRLKKIDGETIENDEIQQHYSSSSSSSPTTTTTTATAPIMNENSRQSSGFPPPPSPTTLRRSNPTNSPVVDPRLDCNFSAVIAKRAAESKARRHENPFPFEFNSTGLPPSTTFFNNCVTTNRIQQQLPNTNLSSQQRFSATANQLLENLKRRGGPTITTPTSVQY